MSTARVVTLCAAGVLALAAGVIRPWEGVRYTPYQDVVGVWTTCYGHTKTVIKGKRYTQAECDALLEIDMREALSYVDKCIPNAPDKPRAAFTSLVFNVGPKGVCGSTLQRKALAGDWKGACAELDRWKYAGGRVYRGLVLRRADERKLCEGGLQ